VKGPGVVGETGALFFYVVRSSCCRPVSDPFPPSASPDSPKTLLDRLAGQFPAAKRQTLRRMIEAGRVTVNGTPAKRAAQTVGAGDEVVVSDRADVPAVAQKSGRAGGLVVVYEDDDLLVVNKPPGLLTSTVPREKRPTLLATVRRHVEARDRAARVGIIHRLDRDASGLLVFSKNHDAYRSLKQQFFEHTVERVYTAVVRGVPEPAAGRVESRLVERADGTVYSARRPGVGERAVTEYEVIERRGATSVVRVKLHTGRKHQIRVHLSERGTPIVGDPVYGRGNEQGGAGLMLAATRLSLAHPRTGRRMTFEAPPRFL
jgi:23S rRNA pseudouridine1911/1915/1917 synthase